MPSTSEAVKATFERILGDHPEGDSSRVNASVQDTGTYLSLYGIDPSTKPTPTRYPQVFSSAGHRLWSQLLDSKDYAACKEKNVSTTDYSEEWTWIIRAFLKKCAADDIYPFTGKDDFQEMATAFLKAARHRIVDYVQTAGLLKHLKVASVTRKVVFTRQNFSITVKAKLRPVNDPTFDRWITTLPSPAFSKHRDGVFRKALHAHVELAYEVTRGDSYLTYTVACISPIRMIDPKYSSREKLSRYVEDKLWLPLVRDHRISDAGNRLF